MKMETTVFAEAAGTVVRVLVAPGDEVETKDLLVELGPETESEAAGGEAESPASRAE